MLAKLRNLMTRSDTAKPPSIPAGQRVYAVGDIHGRNDLFERLITLIEADDAARGNAKTTIVLLGDLIDRGEDSAGVVSRARAWSRRRRLEFIMGNHEEMLLVSRIETDAVRGFLKFGGIETIQSYGVAFDAIMAATASELQHLMYTAIPQEDFDFLESFKPMVRIGDYLFVHAGVRPDIPLDQQMPMDCRWIREPFLSHRGDFGAVVVHGHTITREPEIHANRIGIDTGAFASGILTAIGLEGTERWILQAHDPALATLADAAA